MRYFNWRGLYNSLHIPIRLIWRTYYYILYRSLVENYFASGFLSRLNNYIHIYSNYISYLGSVYWTVFIFRFRYYRMRSCGMEYKLYILRRGFRSHINYIGGKLNESFSCRWHIQPTLLYPCILQDRSFCPSVHIEFGRWLTVRLYSFFECVCLCMYKYIYLCESLRMLAYVCWCNVAKGFARISDPVSGYARKN